MVIGKAMMDKGHEVHYHLYKDSSVGWDNSLNRIIVFGGDVTQYDIIGFSVYTGNHIEVYNTSDKLRKKGIKTVIGGPHATFFHEECRNHADYVFRSESVLSFPEMNDKKTFKLVDADNLIPDREEFYKQSPVHRDNRIKNIMTSFGCPFTCSYCYNSSYRELYTNLKVRLRSVDSVVEEGKSLDCDLIFFQDDFFGYKKDWLKEFNEKWPKIPYHAQMRIEMMDDEKIELLKESGCISVTIAIETFDEKYRSEVLNRKMSNDKIFRNCRKILESGMGLRTEQMLGLPNTTLEDELKLLKLNCEIKPTIAWSSIFQPYRGTALGEYCVANNLYEGDNTDVVDSFFKNTVLNYPQKRKDEIEKLQKIFATCAHIPNGWEYAEQIIKNNNDSLKEHLYSLLYKT